MTRQKSLPLVALALSTLAFLPFDSACQTTKPVFEKFSDNERIRPNDFPDVAAVVLLDRTELTFSFSTAKNKPYAEEVHTKRIQILGEKGLEEQRVMLPFDDRSSILRVEGRVIRPNGEIINMPSDRRVELDRYDPSSPAHALYNAKSYVLFKVSGAQVGDVIEYSYTRIFRDPRWVEPILVGGPYPCVRGEVIINHPKQFDVDFRVTKLGRIVPFNATKLPTTVSSPLGDDGVAGLRHVFVFDKEPALFPEPSSPEIASLATQVHVQLRAYGLGEQIYRGFRDFDDVAAWYRELTQGMDLPDDAAAQEAQSIAQQSGDKAMRVAALQRVLQNRIGDVPTFMQLAALPPKRPRDVVQHRFGDAKDQASLGLAALRNLGIDAFPALVVREGTFAAVPDLPTPAPFNHVILALPKGGGFTFIDPSTPHLPTGKLPGALQGQKALILRSGDAELIDLPVDAPTQNKRLIEVKLSMGLDGTASGTMTVKLDGLAAARGRQFLDANDLGNAAQGLQAWLFPDENRGLSLQRMKQDSLDDARNDDKTLILRADIPPFALGDVRNGNLSVSLERAVGKIWPQFIREMRRYPLVLDHNYAEDLRISVLLPDGMGVAKLPPPHIENNPTMSTDEKWAIADGTLWMNRQIQLDERVIPAERYRDIRDLILGVWARTAQPINIVVGGDRGKAYQGDPF